MLALAASCVLTAGGGGPRAPALQERADARGGPPGAWRLAAGGGLAMQLRAPRSTSAAARLRGGSGQQGAAEAAAAGPAGREPGGSPSMAEQDADALVAYARLLGATHHPRAAGAAGQALRRALDLNPGSAEAAEAYARLLHEDGRAADAARMYRRALSLPEAAATETDGSLRDDRSGALLPSPGNVSELVAHLMAQPVRKADALAGFAALLLTHPALALVSDGAPGADAPGSDSVAAGAQRRGQPSKTARITGVQHAARRLLLHAMALAPSSAACAEGLQDLVCATMLHAGEEDAAAPWPNASSAAPAPRNAAATQDAALLHRCIAEHELRTKQERQQLARAGQHLAYLRKLRCRHRQMHSARVQQPACAGRIALCLCAHVECSSRKCAHFEPSQAAHATSTPVAAPLTPRARALLAFATTVAARGVRDTPRHSPQPELPAAPAHRLTPPSSAATAAPALPPPSPDTPPASQAQHADADADALADCSGVECEHRVAERIAQVCVCVCVCVCVLYVCVCEREREKESESD